MIFPPNERAFGAVRARSSTKTAEGIESVGWDFSDGRTCRDDEVEEVDVY